MTGALAPSLDLGLIGNAATAALIDRQGDIRWMCLPRFDGDGYEFLRRLVTPADLRTHKEGQYGQDDIFHGNHS